MDFIGSLSAVCCIVRWWCGCLSVGMFIIVSRIWGSCATRRWRCSDEVSRCGINVVTCCGVKRFVVSKLVS